MSRAKDIVVKVIPARIANAFVKREHYSGKVVANSSLHLGVFLDGSIHGVMQFGPSLDKRKMIGLVEGTKWNGFLELNRMAFDDALPKNSESRAISIAMRLLRKNAPHIEWVLSFADGCQCGDGTIYRASGFKLIGIKKNTDILKLPDGTITHSFNLKPTINSRIYQKYSNGSGEGANALAKRIGAKKLEGFQIKYIYFLNSDAEARLTVPILPFSEIDRHGARMYKGEKICPSSGAAPRSSSR